jgi:hypothetical protein
MEHSYISAPLFKGIIKSPDNDASIIANGGQDAKTGLRMSQHEYVQFLFRERDRYPQLIQNVARAAASAILAHSSKDQGESRLIAVEGCEHVVGNRVFKGGELMEHLWHNVVPKEIMDELPDPEIRSVSTCTVEEVREVLSMRKDLPGQLRFVTHDYHVPRTKKILKEEKAGGAEVFTPIQTFSQGYMHKSHGDFLKDVIRASEPSPKTVKDEEWKEQWFSGPLHWASHLIEDRIFEDLNIEILIAHAMRRKVKMRSQKPM